ncbi:MAG: hypothetical protein A2X49_06445 [Lentisphaerae bacterium GWF2_52_8]|nr:MAG: hypothetical protein A2X49_06445 [Lentisphaerae bacterium GWF2_52_8]
MRIDSAMNTAYEGMNRQVAIISNAASHIAAGDGSDGNDLLQNMMDIKMAEHSFKANAEVIKTVEDLYDVLLSL